MTSVRTLINSKYFIAVCFIAAAAVRITWILLIDIVPLSDFAWYYEKGLDIASGKGYTIDGTPTAYYPVGYPMFLGSVFFVFGNSLLAAKASNVLLSIGILYFSYILSKKLFNSEQAGRITLFILAIYPNFIAYTAVISTEILFLFLFFLGAHIFINMKDKKWILIITGIIWGLMCLVKPQGFFIPLLFITAIYFKNKKLFSERLKTLLIVYVFIFITLLPWMTRNYYAFGSFFVLSTNEGINLLIGNNPNATGEYNLDENTIKYLWDSENKYASPDLLLRNLPGDAFWTKYGFKDELEANRKFKNKAVDYILNNPAKLTTLLPMKLWYNYKRGNEGIGIAVPTISDDPVLRMNSFKIFKKTGNYFYYLIMLMAGMYFIRIIYKRFMKKQKTYFPLTGLLIILYFTLLSLVFFGGYRFNFPALPWIIMFSAAFIDYLITPKYKIN